MKGKILCLVVLFTVCVAFCQRVPEEVVEMNQEKHDPYTEKRRKMVEDQIIARGVQDPMVLEAMMRVKRHLYVPIDYRRYAYNDEPLPIGHGQTISQPYIVAYMTEALKLNGGDKVLEIGTGSGYQAAILAEIVKEVYTIEIVEPLANRAGEILTREGYDHVTCHHGDGYQGWPEEAPFNAIIVTAAPPKIPEPLIEQLSDGGRMIVPVGTWFQELVLITKQGENIKKDKLIPVRFVPMTGNVQK